MKKSKHLITGSLCILLAGSCQQNSHNTYYSDGLESCPVVASYVQIGDDQVLSCDQKWLTDSLQLPLSFLTEKPEIIHLDNRDEALISDGRVLVSDNYLLVWNNHQNPFKLFDRKGKFLTAIGSYGQGPGEYLNVYDASLDEKNNRIYILPWQSAQLLVYDLEGNSLPSIPLCLRVPKGTFHIDIRDSTIAVVVLPFEGMPAVAWTQDFHGNRKAYIEPAHLTAPQDFSNEVTTNNNVSGTYDVNIFCIIPTRVDSLYHYDYKNNRLRPCFTLNFSEDPIPWHSYLELPNHYMGDASHPVQESEMTFVPSPPSYYIIDKKSRKGAFFRLYNDYLGDTEIDWPIYSFYNGYFIKNMEPANLKSTLEDALKASNLSEEKRQELTALHESLRENDNNVVILARLKE
ncbi:6-bladed beta-propeller [Parabacteroides sp.]